MSTATAIDNGPNPAFGFTLIEAIRARSGPELDLRLIRGLASVVSV